MKQAKTCPKCGCTSCGYAESWVDDKHLDKLKEYYEWENR